MKKDLTQQMFLIKIFHLLSLVAISMGECLIHEEDHFYYNVSDLGLAALDNRVEAVDAAIAGGCEVNYNGTSVLLEYSYSENEYEYGDYEYDYGEYGDAGGVVDGMTALHIAATEGNTEMVAKLLTVAGIEIDMETSMGATPLYDAAGWGNTEIMRMLVTVGADINKQDGHGWTPLHQTCAYGHVLGAELLLNLGADPDIQGTVGDTALHTAVAFAYQDVVEVLLESGADLSIEDDYDMTGLDWAVEMDDKEIEKILQLAEMTNSV